MNYNIDAVRDLVSYQEARIQALESRLNFLTEEINACYGQVSQITEEQLISKI